ncbi:hypothetical protein ACWDOP_16355 [Nocardia sp. NPDC003693]
MSPQIPAARPAGPRATAGGSRIRLPRPLTRPTGTRLLTGWQPETPLARTARAATRTVANAITGFRRTAFEPARTAAANAVCRCAPEPSTKGGQHEAISDLVTPSPVPGVDAGFENGTVSPGHVVAGVCSCRSVDRETPDGPESSRRTWYESLSGSRRDAVAGRGFALVPVGPREDI